MVPEEDDIPLSERVRRTNAHCQTPGKSNVILISIHVNAAGDGSKWMNATGWSCYTCKGQTESDRLANCLYKAAEQILKNQVIRTDYARDGDPDWEEKQPQVNYNLYEILMLFVLLIMRAMDFHHLRQSGIL